MLMYTLMHTRMAFTRAHDMRAGLQSSWAVSEKTRIYFKAFLCCPVN